MQSAIDVPEGHGAHPAPRRADRRNGWTDGRTDTARQPWRSQHGLKIALLYTQVGSAGWRGLSNDQPAMHVEVFSVTRCQHTSWKHMVLLGFGCASATAASLLPLGCCLFYTNPRASCLCPYLHSPGSNLPFRNRPPMLGTKIPLSLHWDGRINGQQIPNGRHTAFLLPPATQK